MMGKFLLTYYIEFECAVPSLPRGYYTVPILQQYVNIVVVVDEIELARVSARVRSIPRERIELSFPLSSLLRLSPELN